MLTLRYWRCPYRSAALQVEGLFRILGLPVGRSAARFGGPAWSDRGFKSRIGHAGPGNQATSRAVAEQCAGALVESVRICRSGGLPFNGVADGPSGMGGGGHFGA